MARFTYGRLNSGRFLLERFNNATAMQFEGALEISPEEVPSVIALLRGNAYEPGFVESAGTLRGLQRVYIDTVASIEYAEQHIQSITESDLTYLDSRIDELLAATSALKQQVREQRAQQPSKLAKAYPGLHKASERLLQWAQGLKDVEIPAGLESDVCQALGVRETGRSV